MEQLFFRDLMDQLVPHSFGKAKKNNVLLFGRVPFDLYFL